MDNLKDNTNDETSDKKLIVSDVRQRLIDRIDELKTNKRNLFGDENYQYLGDRGCKNGYINQNTSIFYVYVYDRLVKELEDILNVV